MMYIKDWDACMIVMKGWALAFFLDKLHCVCRSKPRTLTMSIVLDDLKKCFVDTLAFCEMFKWMFWEARQNRLQQIKTTFKHRYNKDSCFGCHIRQPSLSLLRLPYFTPCFILFHVRNPHTFCLCMGNQLIVWTEFTIVHKKFSFFLTQIQPSFSPRSSSNLTVHLLPSLVEFALSEIELCLEFWWRMHHGADGTHPLFPVWYD